MRRAPLVAAATVIGAAGVLAFPVQHPQAPAVAAAAAPAPASTQATDGAAPAAAPTTAAARTATGADTAFRYGDLAVSVTVSGGRITAVSVATLRETDGRSASIDAYAIPQLEQQAVSANSANIQGISGATFTSRAFAASLSAALSKLGISG